MQNEAKQVFQNAKYCMMIFRSSLKKSQAENYLFQDLDIVDHFKSSDDRLAQHHTFSFISNNVVMFHYLKKNFSEFRLPTKTMTNFYYSFIQPHLICSIWVDFCVMQRITLD